MRHFKLWMLFVVTVTAALVSTFFVTGFLAFAVFRFQDSAINREPNDLVPLLSFLIAAVIVAIILILLISRWFFKPIEQLSGALKQVATGDFHIQLPEKSGMKEVRTMNHTFNRMVKELNSIEMLQTDFIQNVSHEFKTPLASIEGYATLLQGAPLPEELHEYTGRILSSTAQLSSLTGNILRLSRLENQQFVSERTRYPLDEQLRQIVITLEPLWSKKQLCLDIDLPETFYYGNADLISQVWTNLLSNAIKFTPEHGSISIRLMRSPEDITVCISDTGIGMTPEVQSHIFDKFYQGEHNRNIEGNGLGLALVHKIVMLCGGTVTVESQPDLGSRFYVHLPDQNG